MNGYLETCKFLVNYFPLTIDDVERSDILTLSCKNGQLKVCKWLVREFPLLIERYQGQYADLFNSACEYGHLKVVKWLVKIFRIKFGTYELATNQGYINAGNGIYVEIIRFLFDHALCE